MFKSTSRTKTCKSIINPKKQNKMSKTSKNILGDQRGKIGKVVGRVVEGEQMYSAAPGPRGSEGSAKQKEHRARFAAITTMGKPLKGAIRIGFKKAASSKHLQSSFNLFVNRNFKHTIYDPLTGTATPTYADIVLAEGQVPFVNYAIPSFETHLQISIGFTGNDNYPGAFDDDTVYAIAYCPDLAQSAMGIAARSAETLTITVPTPWEGKTVYLWGFTLTSVEEKLEVEGFGFDLMPGCCSVSTYIGSGTVA